MKLNPPYTGIIEHPDIFCHKFEYNDDKSAEFVSWLNNIRTNYPVRHIQRTTANFNYMQLLQKANASVVHKYFKHYDY